MTEEKSNNRPRKYIPRAHEKFRRWAFVFVGRIAQDAASLRISEKAANELREAYREYDKAYITAHHSHSRTILAVRSMNEIRTRFEKMLRKYAQQIKQDTEVPDYVKEALPLNLGKRRRHIRNSAPQSQPWLKVDISGSGRHELRWTNGWMNGESCKPKDAAALQVFAVVADRPMMDHARAQYVGMFTRQPITLDWPPTIAGMTITYAARWINSKGEEGSWSNAVSMQVAFGGLDLRSADGPLKIAQVQPLRKAV